MYPKDVPLEGHVLVSGFGLRSNGCLLTLGAIQLENGFHFAFKTSVRDAVFFVLAAPERAFDLDVGSFLERGGEVGKLFSPDNGTMPFSLGLPLTFLILPGVLSSDG